MSVWNEGRVREHLYNSMKEGHLLGRVVVNVATAREPGVNQDERGGFLRLGLKGGRKNNL